MACTGFVGLAMQAIFTAGRLAPHAGFRLVAVRLAFLSQNRPFLRRLIILSGNFPLPREFCIKIAFQKLRLET
jgi:hypothetical protein